MTKHEAHGLDTRVTSSAEYGDLDHRTSRPLK
jgi:hypothetical protein